jgi:PAS domain S-box-containing protein
MSEEISSTSFPASGTTDSISELKRQKVVLKTGALQNAILNSAHFFSIATDEKGLIQIFNFGAERMLGYTAAEVLNKITPAEISDPQEIIARAKELSLEFGVPIEPGFEALVFRAARGIEDNYELTKIRKDGSNFPSIVSVTALRDAHDAIIGYLLLGTDNTARKLVEAERLHLLKIQEQTNKRLKQSNLTLQLSEERLAVTLNSIGDAVIATDAEARVTLLNPLAEKLTGWTQAEAVGRHVDEVFHIINQTTRLPAIIPVLETLAHGTTQGLANHTVVVALDGSESAIADSCAPIRDRDGLVVGAVLVFRDVTEEYAAQQALEEQQVELEMQNEELRTSQEALHSSQERYLDLYDFAPVGYFTVSEQGLILEANLTTATLLGLPRSELVKKPISRFILNEDEDIYYRLRKQINETGEAQKCELRMVKGSAQIWVQLSVTAAQDNNAPVLRIVMNNINERKLAEEALFKAGALQRAIFDSANFSIIATDAKGVIQIFNVGAERMLGYTAADVMNKVTPAEISDPQEVIARAKALSIELGTPIAPGFEALAFKASRGIEDIYELTYIRKDGSRLPAVVSVTALRDAQDAIIGYLLIGTDNTARKQIETEQKLLDQRLRDQQFYTRSLIESNIDALMATDPLGIISDVNKQMEALTGCTRDELIGAPFKNFFTDPDRAEAAIRQVLSEKKVTNYELTARAMDGKETVVSYNAATFYDRDRRLQGVFAAARDVTERKRMDIELENAKSVAEKANLAKSDFLSSMSHELRTPLNAILGFSQLLESGLPPPTPTQMVRLHQIIKAGWYLLELINEILDLALIESGKLSLLPEPVSLIDVMLECKAMIEPQAQQRDIKLSFLPFDESWCASADRTRVKQVLINLLSNAIKYNREHGTVEVKCSANTPHRLRITVKDSGAGLSPEMLEQLFQPFNRLGQEASGEEGTGIGLVVTKQLIELMGGTIGVQSSVGKGSEFWFELIRAVEPQLILENTLPAEYAPQVQDIATLRTLLYVEDNPANLMLVEQIIEDHPHVRMLSARDGRQGIALAYAHLPNVILMDINLPGLSGFQALELLREDPKTVHIPVIAISANAMQRDIEKGLEAGFFRYITKPIKVNEFMKALDAALKFAVTGVDEADNQPD